MIRLNKAIVDIKLHPRTVYDDKVKQRGAPERIRCKFWLLASA